jgi:predicted acyl esterase
MRGGAPWTKATPPLDRELEVTGQITARLWIASDAPDADFAAKLIDVHSSGADFASRGELQPGHPLPSSGRKLP